MTYSKSTATGLVSTGIGLLATVLAYQVPQALLTPQVSHIWLWVTAAAQLLLLMGRAYLGAKTVDADADATAAYPTAGANASGPALAFKPTLDVKPTNGTATKLMGIAAMGTLLFIAPFTTGCTQAQKISVAQQIVNLTPAFTSAVDLALSTIALLDPPAQLIIAPTMILVNATGPQISKAAQDYLNNPTETNIQVLQGIIVQIQQSVNTMVLQAAHIVNPQSQAIAVRDVNQIAALTNLILGLVQSISTPAQKAVMAADVKISMAQVRPYLDQALMQQELDAARAKAPLAARLLMPATVDGFYAAEAKAGF